MPRNPIIYLNTIIYKICCKNINIKDEYIGHTTDFIKRKYSHKFDCNNEKRKQYNFKVYQFIRENGGWDNFDMIMIEKYPCNTKLEATKRERELIEELKATLNCYLPIRINEEHKKITYEYNKMYRNLNKEKIKNNCKEYYKKNEKILKEKAKEKYQCLCGSFLNITDKSRHLKTKKHQQYLTLLN